PADPRDLIGRRHREVDEYPAQRSNGRLRGDLLPDLQHFGQAARDERVHAQAEPRRERRLRSVLLARVRALDETGPPGVRLPRVQNARDVRVAAIVQTYPLTTEPVVAQPAAARPSGQLGQRALAFPRALPRRAQRERRAQPPHAALARLTIDAEHLGRDAVALVDRGHAACG